MSASHTFLKVVRQIHLYAGVFIAPTLLFFAFTGGLQVFGLHEASRGSDYKPPAWLVTLAQLHKKQTMVVPVHRGRPSEEGRQLPTANPAPNSARQMDVMQPGAAKLDSPKHQATHPLPLKIFCAFVALGLFISTLIGIYMAYRYTRKRALVTALLLAGTVLPIVLASI